MKQQVSALQLRVEEEDLAHVRRGLERQLGALQKKHKALTRRYENLILFPTQGAGESREKLFGSARIEGDEASARIIGKAKKVNESKDFTASLQRMQRRVAAEMKRLDGTQSLLQADAQRVTETMLKTEQYKERTGTASQRLSSIHAKQQREYFYGRIGAAIFMLTILYIVSKRIPPSLINGVMYLFRPANQTEEEVDLNEL